MTKNELEIIFENVLLGMATEVEEGVQRALGEGHPPERILNQTLIPAMAEVGQRFENNEFYVPEMLISAKAMQAGLNVLRPLLSQTGLQPLAKVAIGTVYGDLHDIGKNLVGMMLEGGGFEVIDLGKNVPPEQFVEAARSGVDLIGISALLTTTMTNMSDVIDMLMKEGLRESIKVIIGGAPVTQSFAEEIHADGYAPNAGQAVKVVKRILGLN